MPGRSLFSLFLLLLVAAVAVPISPATAKTKSPVAKIALGAKHEKVKKAKKAKKAKKIKKAKKARKAKRVKRTSAKVARSSQSPAVAVTAPPAPSQCANTDLLPDAGNIELIREAILCLHNQIRAQHGLSTLATNGALAAAGAAHSNDMVARGYFEHDTPEGGTFDQRIMAAGYAKPGSGWWVGENLAWGTAELSTPAGLMNAWMNSPGHRENILKSNYRELGIGIRLGTPTGAAAGVTVSAEFGVRL